MMRMVVKMAAFPSIAVLLLCCSSVASTDSPCGLYAETNKDITLQLGIKLPNSEQLEWKKDGTIIFRRRQDKVITGAEGDVTQDGSLKLKKVSQNKTGTYTPNVFGDDGRAVGGKKSIKLCVMDPVPKPTLNFGCTKTQIKVTCNVPQGTNNLTFVWVQDGKVLKDQKNHTLQLKLTKDLETATFSCNVSNKVSSLGSATEKQTCIKSDFPFPDKIFGISTWYFVGGGGGVVLLLIILVIICCIRMRQKKTMQVKDEEELRLGWTNPNQQHHHHQHGPAPNQHQHHHHHHHQQQPAGHTGPRQHRSKQPRSQQRPSRDPAHPNGQPQPSPRRAAQVPRPVDTADDEKPPPLPQPRKKAPKTARV